MDVLWPLLRAILATGLILVLAYWATRYLAGRAWGSGPTHGSHIKVLEQVAVGREQRLLLVQVKGRVYFLSATPSGIRKLGELPLEEIGDLGCLTQQADGGDLPNGFLQALHRVLEQRKRSGE